ncbi:MAG TPA: gliding motility-associated C-terminal domain-containing protein, partial [Cyclobacteriaceae bacterium]|nr:gliding motility-associated C-terminal domain-containing protein [Cyclobacteriaceae bacterium]
VSGGNAPYTYQFNGASTSSLSFGTLAAGNYTFAVTDALGCAKNFPFTISSPGYADFTTQVTSPSCLGGGADGKIDVQINTSGNFDIGITTDPNNDPSPFQFLSRSNISTPVSFTGLSQGTYRVVVKPNGALCSTPQTVVISTGPAAVDFDLKAMDFYCFETKGTVKIFNIKGSTSVDYTYEIVNLGTIVRTGGVTQLQTLDTVTLPLPQVGLDKGNYQVRLFQDQSAATGCSTPISSAFKNFSIDGPTLISFDTLSVVRLQSQYSLATGSMSITLDNTFAPRYQWMLKLIAPDITGQTNSHNDFDSQWIMPSTSIGPVTFEAQNLYAGSYQLSIRDSIGCLRTYPLSINLDAEIFIPNIFTPNNDSKNDNFEILYLPPNSKITITNRWGKQVLSGSSFPLATDGITSIVWNGGTESDGVYFYTLDTPKKTYTGWVELKR